MAELKLKGATSGSTTITAPATGSDEVIELSTALGSKVDYPSGGADGDALIKDGASALWGTAGKILQIVRATDSTDRSTTSTSFVDASIEVTITPQKSDSAILLISSNRIITASTWITFQQITDNSNNAISGAEDQTWGGSPPGAMQFAAIMIARDTPATINATTYKVRFKTQGGTAFSMNSLVTAQLFAIEVAA